MPAARQKPERIRLAIFHLHHGLTLEFEDPVAIETNEMPVVGVIERIWIVIGLVTTQIELAQQTALDQQAQRAIDRRS